MIHIANRLLRERDRRSRYVPSAFTTGAAWGILLDLYRAEPQRISSVCYGTGEPYTTALRHLAGLESADFVSRVPCEDRRGALLRLSPWARERLTDYLTAIAAATGTAKTAKQAECEASQSGSRSEIAQTRVA